MGKKHEADFLARIAELANALRQQLDAAATGWDNEPEAIAERRRSVCDDVSGYEFFDRTYFPHYGTAEPGVLHTYLHHRLPAIVNSPRGQRDAIAAPRGDAKSTKISLVFLLWCVVRKLKHYPLLFMDAFEQAAEMLEAVKVELESNPRLASDFPEACGQGRVWRVGCIVTANNVKIEAFGVGKRVRGRRHGPHRPDLAILDDIENDENSATPAQRDKLQRYVTKAVLSLGPVDDSMDAILVGTVLHYDSVLSRFLKHPMWHSRTFRAVLKWPDRMDLWDRFEELLLNAGSPDEGLAAAQAHYLAHQVEMDAGAEVSWPSVRPLVQLMIKRARDGHEAFDSEQQNDPLAGDDAPFAHCIQFWVNRLAEWRFFGSCDPSLGKQNKGRDPSAILVGGYQREKGILDVVHASIRRRVPDKIISDVIEAQREWDCAMWYFEATQFQEFARTELLKRSAIAGVPVPAMPFERKSDKDLDIESLQPHVAHGQIRFHPSLVTLLTQLRHYPKADHDDGPDALYMLWKLATSGGRAAGATVEGTGGKAEGSTQRQTARARRRRAALM